MRFVSYELSTDTKLTTDNQNVAFSSYLSEIEKRMSNCQHLHDFQNKPKLSGCLIFVSHHATCKLSDILGHALPRLQSPLLSPDKAALSAHIHEFSTELS